jgi:hypothetical protein
MIVYVAFAPTCALDGPCSSTLNGNGRTPPPAGASQELSSVFGGGNAATARGLVVPSATPAMGHRISVPRSFAAVAETPIVLLAPATSPGR